MILSMTGFGKTETQWEDKNLSVEIRSLNSKNADINLRTPSYLREMDTEIRKRIAQQLHRGKIDLNIFIEFNGQNAPSTINTSVVKSYIGQLKEIGDFSENEMMAIAMRLPDTLSSERETLQEVEKEAIFNLLNQVIKDIESYRRDEGKALEKDFLKRIDLIEGHLTSVIKIDPERSDKIEQKLRSALDDLKIEVDTNRFEQELIFYLEKFDITEEKVRLKNHLDYFKEVMKNDFPNGKKLGFIAQEMGREINTIGSKANHAELQKVVVQMKDELEKIKEQLLNVL
ncbi:YicC family protein [Flavobacteriaceae bacterium]|nr:YicC family protein [Flavobacteriaceae bacterium]MDB9873086.1 YicC family protein [Flavobacteriaceae bacterium]MDC0132102.1 YicC family protein [Flavobacteriaceae bacterium]MDC3367338.1 YicC family protein [Flavobacteriaceae bacterium]